MSVLYGIQLVAAANHGSESSNLWYFLIAYLILWIILFGYLFYLHGRMNELEEEVESSSNQKDVGDADEEDAV